MENANEVKHLFQVLKVLNALISKGGLTFTNKIANYYKLDDVIKVITDENTNKKLKILFTTLIFYIYLNISKTNIKLISSLPGVLFVEDNLKNNFLFIFS